jgi:hypothetical protein
MPMVACVWRICFAFFIEIAPGPACIRMRGADGFAGGGRR